MNYKDGVNKNLIQELMLINHMNNYHLIIISQILILIKKLFKKN
jgi:hypothetical protein